jgi:hypothetical protein
LRPRLVAVRSGALILAAALTGCGGFVVSIGDETLDGGGSTHVTDDGGIEASRDATGAPDVAHRDAGLDADRRDSVGPPPSEAGTPKDASAVCPLNKPALGSHCSDIGLECEYGTDPSVACNDIVTCTAAGWTQQAATGTPCAHGSCPATYAGVTTGTMCSPTGTTCDYPQGTCTCAPPTGPLTEAGAVKWQCFPVQVGCPSPRPSIGAACSTASGATTCNYGACADGVELTCKGDVWTEVMTACSE